MGRIGDVHLRDMPTIGEQLKQARESLHLSIPQAVQATRIRSYYLEAMEADDFSAMPSAAQARGFLRSYADYLSLNADELINVQRNEAANSLPFDEMVSPPGPPEADTPPEQPLEVTPSPVPAQAPAPEPAPLEQSTAQDADPTATPEPEAPQVIQPDRPPAPSQLIFVEIGRELRQRRELLSLTLDEIERHTRVRQHYLEKIENADYEALPSPVQARGMLSNYASFLDLDAEAILLRFADGLQARRLERQPATPPKSTLPRTPFTLPPWLGRFISPDLLFGGGMILLLFFLTVWGGVRIFSGTGGAGATQTAGPSISDVLLASPVATAAPNDALPTSVALVIATSANAQSLGATDTPAPPGSASNVEVTISVLERTFIRVTVDGTVKQDARVVPGAGMSFSGQQSVEILTGSGSGIHVIFNEQDLGTMGNFGEVVDRIYTVNGVETPTATSSPTDTATPRFQKTPSRTPTSTPTLRPTPTSNN